MALHEALLFISSNIILIDTKVVIIVFSILKMEKLRLRIVKSHRDLEIIVERTTTQEAAKFFP